MPGIRKLKRKKGRSEEEEKEGKYGRKAHKDQVEKNLGFSSQSSIS